MERVFFSCSMSTPILATFHIRASQWDEDNGLDIEAFHHAAAANDVERAERLIEGLAMLLAGEEVAACRACHVCEFCHRPCTFIHIYICVTRKTEC